jgi:hypothetical protein
VKRFVIAMGLAACGGAPRVSTTIAGEPAAACDDVRTSIGDAARTHDVAAADRIARGAEAADPACRASLGHDLGSLARWWHRDGVARGDEAAIEAALRMYRVALDVAPDAPDAGDTLYYEGELLWTRAEHGGPSTPAATWRAIAETYDRALDHGVPDANRKEAAYAAFMAWRTALGDPKADAPAGTRPYTDAEAVLLREARRDLQLDPARDPNVVYYAGRIAWGARHADDAGTLLGELLDRDDVDVPPPDVDELAGYAGVLLFDTLVGAGNDVAVQAWIRRLRARPALLARHPDLAAIVDGLVVQTQRKDAERLEANRDWRGCAEAYEAILRDHPRADRAEEVAWNEGVCWSRADERDRAAAAYRDVLRIAPGSPTAANARAELERQDSAIAP